jgi:uroporphyrinogen decarboxylase
MTSRERIRAIVAGEPADRCGFWLGNPHRDTWPILHEAFGIPDQAGVRRWLGDDLAWLPASGYRHPDGLPMFDYGLSTMELSAGGAALRDCETVAQVDAFPWPDPQYFDFSDNLARLRAAGDLYRCGGMWSPFFHIVADFLGMENYFVRMYTHPEVVHAVTRHVVDAFLAGNRLLFEQAGDEVDAFFFGNDFGTQLDLLISPDMFREFVAPYFRELVSCAKDYGRQVVLHSCGAIARVIPDLLAMGVDALHPLQARAMGMSAEELAHAFGGRVGFIGAVDTQDLLVHGTPDEVRAEVRRLKRILGPRLVVSPSHEAVLPDVPPANLVAMAEETRVA